MLNPSGEIRLTAEERARHAALSPVQAAWLDFVADHPEALERSAFAELDALAEIKDLAGLEPERVQSWPLFLDPQSLVPLTQAGRETIRLIKTVPERIFDNDLQRMVEFYDVGEPLVRGAVTLLADPDCLGPLIGRGDFILGPHGFACCEFNIAGNLGGLEMGLWKDKVRTQRLVAEFLAKRGLRVLPLDTMDVLLEHAVEVGLARGLAAEGELNFAVINSEPVPPALLERAAERYRKILARHGEGLTGSLIACTEKQLTLEDGRARFGGMPVQLFLDQIMDKDYGPVFRAQAAGRGFAFNGLVSPILSDKRNLALLSEQADDGDLYDAEERAAIARFIPWTRLLTDSFTDRAGERIYLPDFVRAERELLVIKSPDEFGGKNVLVGSTLTQAEWEARLDAALADQRWVVQDFIRSEPYLFQAREGGAALYDLIWGVFVFGERFGSCLVRGAPSGAGAVNLNRGGWRTVFLEVENGATVSSTEPSRHEETCDAQ